MGKSSIGLKQKTRTYWKVETSQIKTRRIRTLKKTASRLYPAKTKGKVTTSLISSPKKITRVKVKIHGQNPQVKGNLRKQKTNRKNKLILKTKKTLGLLIKSPSHLQIKKQ